MGCLVVLAWDSLAPVAVVERWHAVCGLAFRDALRAARLGRRRRRVPWCDAMAVRVSCRMLKLNNNQLTGSIPSTLGNLTALT